MQFVVWRWSFCLFSCQIGCSFADDNLFNFHHSAKRRGVVKCTMHIWRFRIFSFSWLSAQLIVLAKNLCVKKCWNVRKVRTNSDSISMNYLISCWSIYRYEGHEKLLIMLDHWKRIYEEFPNGDCVTVNKMWAITMTFIP